MQNYSVRKSAGIIRQIESSSSSTIVIPVVVRYFSIDGAFVAEKLEHMIQDAISGQISTNKNHDKGDADDLKLIHERLSTKRFEVLDSSPAYLYESNYFRAIDTAVPSLPLRIIFKGYIFLWQSSTRKSWRLSLGRKGWKYCSVKTWWRVNYVNAKRLCIALRMFSLIQRNWTNLLRRGSNGKLVWLFKSLTIQIMCCTWRSTQRSITVIL